MSRITHQLASIKTSLQQIKNQINAANSEINSLELRPVITSQQASLLSDFEASKDQLNDLSEKIDTDEAEISYDQIQLKQQYFQIFYAALITCLTIFGAALFLIYAFFKDQLRVIKEKIGKEIAKDSKEVSLTTIAEIYASLIMPWWDRYEEQYQRFKKKENGFETPAPFIRDVRLSISLAERGLIWITPLREENYLGKDSRALIAYAKLSNHWVYHKTVELDCTEHPDESNVFEVLREANNCLSLSKNSETQNLWYDLQQTAAFAFLLFGEDRQKQKAKKILRDLIEGKTPERRFNRPPDHWRNNLFEEFFPKNPTTGQRDDSYAIGLDQIKYKPMSQP